MTSTDTLSVPTVRAGKTSSRRMLLATVAVNFPRDPRIRGLIAELDEIAADQEMAARYLVTGSWLAELSVELRDVWEHLYEALTTHNVHCAPAHSQNLTKPLPTWHARASRDANVRGNVR
jgi:pyruvoyl-dependent arginine decarboxylase (PvlArgDC)